MSDISDRELNEILERWARWRFGARWYQPAAIASGGQYLGGRGSRVCPTCKGSKRLPGHLVGASVAFINMPCPQCNGEGRISGNLASVRRQRLIACVYCRFLDPRTGVYRSTGEMPDGRTCHKCHGGRRLVVDLQVHPATIKGTAAQGRAIESDPLSAQINATVIAWQHDEKTVMLAKVLVAEYCHNGTQEMKAKKMGNNRQWFKRQLREARARIRLAILAK